MVNTLDKGSLTGSIHVNIYYEDTDLSGFVYHANYLKYFERAREHLIGLKFLRDLHTKGVHFVVSDANIRYLYPAKHGDCLVVESHGHYTRSPAVYFNQMAYVLTNGEKKLATKAEITLATLNLENRPIRLPDFMTDHFRQVQPETQPSGIESPLT